MPYIYDSSGSSGGGGSGVLPKLMVNDEMDLIATIGDTSPFIFEMGGDSDLLYDVIQTEGDEGG